MKLLVTISLLCLISGIRSVPSLPDVDRESRLLFGLCDSSPVTLNAGQQGVFRTPKYPFTYGWFSSCTKTFSTTASFMQVQCDPVNLGPLATLSYVVGQQETLITRASTSNLMTNSVTLRFNNQFIFPGIGASCTVRALAESNTDCNCGQIQDCRIIGGATVECAEKTPWMAGITRRGVDDTFCGGSLISDSYVLTAAHCFVDDGITADQVDVRLGVMDQSDGTQGFRKQVREIINHPMYTNVDNVLTNDYTLLRIDPIDFSDMDYEKIRPICLPADLTEDFNGKTATATGWGSTVTPPQTPSFPNDLQTVDLTVVSNAACDTAYGGSTITDEMLCALETGKDTCGGDSGGPLTVTENQVTELIGITSWGRGCAAAGIPGVYARVTDEQQWILNNIDTTGLCARP